MCYLIERSLRAMLANQAGEDVQHFTQRKAEQFKAQGNKHDLSS